MTRLARGSMPWPTPSASDQPACRGALTVEEQIDPGSRPAPALGLGRTARGHLAPFEMRGAMARRGAASHR